LFDIEPTKTLLLLAILGALLPDIDHPSSIIGSICSPISSAINRYFGHRTLTHSLAFVAIIATVFMPLILLNWHYYIAIIAGCISHIISDGFNVSGVPLLYPNKRIFYFLPEGFLIKAGSKQEFVYFLIISLLAFAILGVSFAGLRTVMFNIIPGFNGAMFNYMKDCDGPGSKYICSFDGYVCDEYCGPLNGVVTGLYNVEVIFKDESLGYFYLNRYNYQSGEIIKGNNVSISYNFQEIKNNYPALKKPNGLVTVSGYLNDYKFHSILLEDLNYNEFIENGKIMYKIRK
jgi:membrane-bound metal-dependent hydrolase YbcI (DUF457 family)